MRRVGQARKRDANEPAIVKALEAVGAHVTRLSGVGAPDVLVRFPAASWGNLYAFEIKTAKGKQTEAQIETQWPIVRSIEDALQAIGVKA